MQPMKKADFWKSDWFFGVAVSVVMLILGNGELLQGLERKAYDMGVGAATRTPSDKVAVIAIDKQSLDNIGRWPGRAKSWPRWSTSLPPPRPR